MPIHNEKWDESRSERDEPSIVHSMNRNQVKGLFFALLAVVLFSLTLPMTRWALESYSPVFTATSRAVLAAILAIACLKIAGESLLPPGHYREFAFTALGAVFGWPILIALALTKTETAPVAVVASIMPLVTAIFAVQRGHENVSRQFWIASVLGTAILIYYTASRGGISSNELVADFLTFAAVLASSFCYVRGAELTRTYPGWKVVSWIVVLSLPITASASLLLWLTIEQSAVITARANIALLVVGLSSMYFGFILWYRGLKDAGTARGAQVQQLQVFFTLAWSVLILGETVPASTLICSIGIVIAVSWAIFSRKKAE